jgi:hypothetical protein
MNDYTWNCLAARGESGGAFKGRRLGTHFSNKLKIRHDLKRKMGRKIFRFILRFSIVRYKRRKDFSI